MKENLDTNKPNTKFCFIKETPPPQQQQQQQQQEGMRRATMNILNPDSGLGETEREREKEGVRERDFYGMFPSCFLC